MNWNIGLVVILLVIGFGAGITVSAMKKGRLQFVKDGSVSGWVFTTIGTVGLFGAYAACFFQDRALNVMDKIGYQLVFAWASMFGLWSGLKTARKIWGKIPNVPQNVSQNMDQIFEETEKK